MKKRILSILAVLAILICVCVLTVSAAGETRTQCECGGTATGKQDHTCKNIDFLPWADSTSLPASGNYYLTTDVTLPAQHPITGTLRLDLNGHSITHKVTNTTDSRVFFIADAGKLAITDSTDKPGKVTRDLSELTAQQAESIGNWGLLFLVENDSTKSGEINATGTLSLYNGIFDATGQYSGGGSVISNGGLNFTVNIYGGELKGGITKGVNGAIYSVGHVNMFGGKLSGGIVHTTSKASTGGIHITVTTGQARHLTLSGDAEITGNYRTSDGITYEDANTRIRWGQLYMKGTFTGCVSITCVDSKQNVVLDPINSTWFADYPIFYNGGANVNTFDMSGGAILIDNEPKLGGEAKEGQIWLAETRNQCECGGKAEGKYGHTCKILNFLPWDSATSFPSHGNYYLETDVTIASRKVFVNGNRVRIDLNGNDIIRKVTTKESSTSIFSMDHSGVSYLSITDSTSVPGTVTRDLSALDAETQAAIRNYGLLLFLRNVTGGMTIYDGIYDFDGAYCDSASVIYNASANSTLNIYGGDIRCGITPTSNQGAIYSTGPVGLYGGKITGSKSVAANTAAVKLSSTTNYLTISGNVEVTGNSRVTIAADGSITAVAPANIFVNPSQLKFAGTFTGNVGISPVASGALTTPAVDMKIGSSEDAVIDGTVTIDGYKEYTAKVSGDNVVIAGAYSATTDHGMNTYYYDSLAEAIADYPGGESVIRLVQDVTESVTFPQTTYIDLNGCDIAAATVTSDATLYAFDSKTRDYTVEDGEGYGKMGAITGSVQALPAGNSVTGEGYLMITEDSGTSFHRLTLEPSAMTLRSSCVGLYYESVFGCDEVVVRNIAAYGTAMGANVYPNFKGNTYTRFTDVTGWKAGTNIEGTPNMFSNGTLLDGIMAKNNDVEKNKANAKIPVYTMPYIELKDGTRIDGICVCYSLQELLEGSDGLDGIDIRWDTLPITQQSPVIKLYEEYPDVVKTWKTPRILLTVFGISSSDEPYEDDGILKILMIGHSLGIDSAYFFPEVYKEETGKDVVVGLLYRSGCPLYEHVVHLGNNAKKYAYYEFDTRKDIVWRRAKANGAFQTVAPDVANDTLINDGTIAVTMQFGIKQADWDLVVTQAGVWEVAGKGQSSSNATITANIQTLRNYVLNQDIEKRSKPEFAWNITWAPPSKESGLLTTSYSNNLTNYFNGDTTAMFNGIAKVVNEAVMPAGEWKYIFPSGTALHNAKTVMADTLLYRDTVHASDFGRLMIAYTWLCRIEGTSIEDYDITSIYSQLRRTPADRNTWIDYALTAAEKANLKKFVKAALETPYAITDCNK